MVRFCLNSIGRKRYFGQTDILLVASEKYRQLPYKNILRVRGNDERFTRLLPPPEGSGFPPMANERILFMKNGIICKEDGDALLEIYRAINVYDGSLNRNLTMEEMVLIFAIGYTIKENFAEGSEADGN